jgi:hypothetical protein
MRLKELDPRMILGSALLAAALLSSVATEALATAITAIDSFSITRNGGAFFTDDFTDGFEPPSAPSFASGASASYSVGGTIPGNAETGGKLNLDSSLGQLFINAPEQNRLSQSAVLLTDFTSANTTLGLKRNFTFVVSGVFDLTSPPELADNYGIVVIDRVPGQGVPGDEQLQVDVIRSSSDGKVRVRLVRQDFTLNTLTIIGQQVVDFGQGDQILLMIDHASANSDDLLGSFQYVNGGLPVGSAVDLGTSTMFRGENWVRADFFAAQDAVPEPNAGILLLSGIAILAVARVRQRRRISK